MNKTKFSIIIPVYNTVETFLNQCIASVNNLQYDNYEVLIIDDASSDTTKEVIKKLSSTNNKIKVITHAQNKGLAGARTTGIENACSDYTIFLDSDDTLDTDSLNVISSIIEEYRSDVVMFSLPRFKEKPENIVIDDCFFEPGIITKDKVMQELLSFHTNSICEKCGRTEILKECYKKIDKSIVMGEDLQQSTNLILNSNTFYFTDKRIYYYRINEVKRDYYNYTNLNDMNFMIPTYNEVFVNNSNDKYLPYFKLASANAVIYRAFKLCRFKERKMLLNKLNDTQIVRILNQLKKTKIALPSQLLLSLITNKHYFLVNILSKIYNSTHPEF